MSTLLLIAKRQFWTSTLLLLFLFQAYIPVGFMPASGTPFLLELCPAATPMSMPMMGHHHHHSGTTHDEFQSCPFGCAPAAGPTAHNTAFAPPAPIGSQILIIVISAIIRVRFDRAHAARGPPSLA